MFNKFKKAFMESLNANMEVVKLMQYLKKNPRQVYQVIDEILGQKIYHGLHVELAGSKPNAAIIKTILGNNIIVVNEHWLKLPIDQKEAIIAHEIGHLEYKHLELKPKLIKRVLGFNSQIKMELEADNYALRRGYGKPLKEYLISHALRNKELKLRLAAIDKYM